MAGLTKRKQTWHLRMRVPRRYRAIESRSEITRSLAQSRRLLRVGRLPKGSVRNLSRRNDGPLRDPYGLKLSGFAGVFSVWPLYTTHVILSDFGPMRRLVLESQEPSDFVEADAEDGLGVRV